MMQSKNKFNAHKVTYRGMTFDSRKEFKRFLYLQFLEKKGVISQLRRQVKFQIIPPLYVARTVNHAKTTRIKSSLVDSPAYYTCDFLYLLKLVNLVNKKVCSCKRSNVLVLQSRATSTDWNNCCNLSHN